jgi:hypothetical protein
MFRVLGFLALFAVTPCWAQRLRFGIQGGARLTAGISSYFASSESKRYVIGPAVVLRLPAGFALEGDALYRRTGFRTWNAGFWGGYQANYRANTWEFPLLLKYTLPLSPARSFVEIGYALRHMAGYYNSVGYTVDIPTGGRTFYSGRAGWNPDISHGLVTGGGIEFGRGHLRVAPELRYTRWNNDPVNFSGSHGYVVNAARNQVDLLVGVAWER